MLAIANYLNRSFDQFLIWSLWKVNFLTASLTDIQTDTNSESKRCCSAFGTIASTWACHHCLVYVSYITKSLKLVNTLSAGTPRGPITTQLFQKFRLKWESLYCTYSYYKLWQGHHMWIQIEVYLGVSPKDTNSYKILSMRSGGEEAFDGEIRKVLRRASSLRDGRQSVVEEYKRTRENVFIGRIRFDDDTSGPLKYSKATDKFISAWATPSTRCVSSNNIAPTLRLQEFMEIQSIFRMASHTITSWIG